MEDSNAGCASRITRLERMNRGLAVVALGLAQFSHGGGGFASHGPASKGAAVLYLKGARSLRFFHAEGAVTNQVLAGPK